MKIRKTKKEDINRIMEIYARARAYMAANGNPTQWGTTRPTKERVMQDIQEEKSYVCEKGHEIVAVFYFSVEEDPTYDVIADGQWLEDEPYGVIHRIAVSGQEKGVGSYCVQWAWQQHPNLRIDTHENNVPMQAMLKKNGFEYCGKIYIADGSERLAYQKK